LKEGTFGTSHWQPYDKATLFDGPREGVMPPHDPSQHTSTSGTTSTTTNGMWYRHVVGRSKFINKVS
jgi:hypothetical protein